MTKPVLFGNNTNEKEAGALEIYDKRDKGYIEVWLTNAEQQYDRKELTHQLLEKVNVKKCKVVYFLSGSDDLISCTESLLKNNLGCA